MQVSKHNDYISRIINTCRIVGLGESTHGTHEFFANKSKIIKQLVAENNFDTLLFEDNQESVKQINDHIKTGNGNLKSLIKKLYPVWQTQELFDLFEWMRANHKKYPMGLVGFDIDQSKVKPKHRDKFMAENIQRYLDENPASRCVVWAHNFHIAKTSIDDFLTTGYYLQKWFGKDYYAIAQLFGRGELSATIIDENKPNGTDRTLSTISVKSLPKDFFENYLDSLSKGEFIIETKDLPKKKLTMKQKIRSIGWGLVPSKIDVYVDELVVAKAYDAIIYCPKSSRSKPI